MRRQWERGGESATRSLSLADLSHSSFYLWAWYLVFNPLAAHLLERSIYLDRSRLSHQSRILIYGHAYMLEISVFSSLFRKMSRCARSRDSHSLRMQVRTYVSVLSRRLNLLLGATVQTKVHSYGAYFVTRVSPFSYFEYSIPLPSLSLLITSLCIRVLFRVHV